MYRTIRSRSLKRILRTLIQTALLMTLGGAVSCNDMLGDMGSDIRSLQQQFTALMIPKPLPEIAIRYDGHKVAAGELIDMGGTFTDSPKQIQFTITNIGNVDVSLEAVEINGRYADRFSIDGFSNGTVLAATPAGSTVITVTFRSDLLNDGYKAATLSINTGSEFAPFNLTVACERMEIARARMEVWRGNTLIPDEGSYYVGSVTGTISSIFTIKNSGTAPLILTNAVELSDAMNFTITGPAASTTIPVNGSVSLVIGFVPTVLGTHASDVTIYYDDAIETGAFSFGITADAESVPTYEIDLQDPDDSNMSRESGYTFDFGQVELNTQSPGKTFQIHNLGIGGILDIESIEIINDPENNFSYAGPHNASIPAADSTPFTVYYNPTTVSDNHTARLVIRSNDDDEDPYEINLQGGSLQPSVTVKCGTDSYPDGSTVIFGAQNINISSEVKTFTITNEGSCALTISNIFIDDDEYFDYSGPHSASLDPGASASFTLYYYPTALSTPIHTAAITILSDDPDPAEKTYVLNIEGSTLQPNILVKEGASTIPANSTYPLGPLGADGNDRHASPIKTFTIHNTGQEILTITDIAFTGDTQDFDLVADAVPAVVPAGESTTFTMRFDPLAYNAADESRSVDLAIASDDPDTASYPVTFTGTSKPALLNISVSMYYLYTGYCADADCSDGYGNIDLRWDPISVKVIGSSDPSTILADGSSNAPSYTTLNIPDVQVDFTAIPKEDGQGIQIHAYLWDYDLIGSNDTLCNLTMNVAYDGSINALYYTLSGGDKTIIGGTDPENMNETQIPWIIPLDGATRIYYLYTWDDGAGAAFVPLFISASDFLY